MLSESFRWEDRPSGLGEMHMCILSGQAVGEMSFGMTSLQSAIGDLFTLCPVKRKKKQPVPSAVLRLIRGPLTAV